MYNAFEKTVERWGQETHLIRSKFRSRITSVPIEESELPCRGTFSRHLRTVGLLFEQRYEKLNTKFGVFKCGTSSSLNALLGRRKCVGSIIVG